MNLAEIPDVSVLRAGPSGLGEGDISIEVENNVLTIAGERKAEHDERHEGCYRIERATERSRARSACSSGSSGSSGSIPVVAPVSREPAVGRVAVDRDRADGRRGRRWRCRGAGRRGRLQETEDAASDVSLEAAQRFAAALAFGSLARDVGGCRGVQPGFVTARRCSAQLSWRLPPRSRRWRSVRPEDAGIGAAPQVRANLASVENRSIPAISPISFAAVSTPQPCSASSCGARRATSVASSRCSASIERVSSRMRRSSSRATLTRAVCSARAKRPATRSCQQAPTSALVGISYSGHRSWHCQRRSLISAVRCATRRSRWSTSSRTSRSGPASRAIGSEATPSPTSAATSGLNRPRVGRLRSRHP